MKDLLKAIKCGEISLRDAPDYLMRQVGRKLTRHKIDPNSASHWAKGKQPDAVVPFRRINDRPYNP